MKIIVDAQLPVKLNHWLIENGVDSMHVIDLPNKEFTSDIDIINFAVNENRIIKLELWCLPTAKAAQVLARILTLSEILQNRTISEINY